MSFNLYISQIDGMTIKEFLEYFIDNSSLSIEQQLDSLLKKELQCFDDYAGSAHFVIYPTEDENV